MKRFITLLTLLTMLTTYLNAQTKIDTIQLRHDSTHINYIQNGEGENTLLFLHGWCINKNYWEEQIRYFSDSHLVIAMDLPGFGHSTALRENWTIEEYARDVIAFIEALELQNVVLVGHSMSGEVILEAALQQCPAIKGIIGIDNFKFIGVEFTPEEIKEYTSFMQLMERDYENMMAAYADQYLFHPSTDNLVRASVKSDFINANQEIALSSLKELMMYGERETVKLEKLNYKLFLINSDAVPTNISGLEKHCKSSFEVMDIHATGHYPMVEKPSEFNMILEMVLAKIE